jgi:translocation and assembly module TamB
VAGSLAWPRLEVTRGDVVLDAGSRVALQGVYDLHAKSVATAKIEGHLAPAWLQRWLPAGVAIGGADFNATASGPVTGLEHAGELRLTSVQMSPFKLAEARATWRSRGAALDDVALHVAAGATTLDLAGDVRDGRATLKSLHFAPAGSEVWQLADPVAIEWQPAWRIAGLHLRGPDSRVSVDWAGGEAGTLEVGIEKLKSAWWRDVIDLPGPDWQLQTLRFKGGLVGGKLGFAVEAQGEIELSPRPANVALTATGDADGVRLTGLKIVEGGRVLAQAQGRLPVVWDERARPVLRVDLQAPFELRATTEPSSPLWAALAQSLGLGLDGPAADVQVGGTLANPTGELHLAVDRLTIPPGRAGISLPAIEKLALTVHAGRGVLTLDELTARVDGQPVRASGHLPMDEARWRQLARNRSTFDWSKAEGRIDIAEADMAPIARYLPAYLATQGKLQAHVAFSHGELSGELKLREAATRPLPALGIVQEISADVTLDGRTLNIRSFSGKLGGQPCTLQGSIGLQTGAAPRYALALKGEGVPLVRQAGLLVRSDLDLHALTDAAGVTRIEGSMNITDCLILSDLRALLPTGERGVARPPPYFSLDTAPFSSWPLAVELRATHTVRIRTAVFNGTASAHFQLSGTLGSPVAVGETTIDQGQVGFPFVAFNVQFGAVRLTGADPYHPQLSVNGTARRFGYDLRMQSQGPVDQPTVTFTSNPALESEQVLLMVMAGQAPTGDNTVSGSQQRLSRLSTYFGQSLFQQFGVGSDRLEITSGEQVSEKGRETYKIDYKLADRWSLVGEYDEFDDYNAGVKWRVYTSGGKSDIK